MKDHCNGLPISSISVPAQHEIYGKSNCRNLYVSDRHCLPVSGVLHKLPYLSLRDDDGAGDNFPFNWTKFLPDHHPRLGHHYHRGHDNGP